MVPLLHRTINKLRRIAKWLLVENPLSRKIRTYDYEQYFRCAEGVNLFRGVFDSMQAAAASAPGTKPLGYNNPGPAAMYIERTNRIYASDYPVLYWLRRLLDDSNNSVFDLGGHIGVSYYSYAQYLDYPHNLRWTVCDVNEVVEAGKSLAADKKAADSLEFTSDYAAMNGRSILFASGSLQYIEPDLADLIQAVEQPPTHVIVNMLPVHKQYSYTTLQNIGTAFCPYRIIDQSSMLSSMQAAGYDCVDSWRNEEKACPIPFHPDHSLDHYQGYYFRRHIAS